MPKIAKDKSYYFNRIIPQIKHFCIKIKVCQLLKINPSKKKEN